ncbi:unnamed protein product [Aphanomyces euteiches]
MSISIQDTSYLLAAQMANAIAHVFKESLPVIMNVDNVNILNEASLTEPTEPVQTSLIVVLFVTAIVAGFLAILLAFLLDYFDHTLQTEADVMRLLGESPLTSVAQMKKKSMKLLKSPAPAKQGGEAARAKLIH